MRFIAEVAFAIRRHSSAHIVIPLAHFLQAGDIFGGLFGCLLHKADVFIVQVFAQLDSRRWKSALNSKPASTLLGG